MTEQPPISVGIVGATGYAGQELVRLLARHPRTALRAVTASGDTAGPRRLPALARIWDSEVTPYSSTSFDGIDTVFLSVPEALAAALALEHLTAGRRVFDLSGAYRLRDASLRGRFYPNTPDPLPDHTLYALPELARSELPDARLVSCPGCYPAATLLGIGPLAVAGLLEGDVIVDAKSGVSGAGKAPSERTHFSENHGSVAAYGLFAHRHTPEMEQALGLPVTFVPHLVPLDRGLLATIYARVAPGVEAADLTVCYEAAYRHAAFVRLTGDQRLPEIKHVAHTNFCDIGWRLDRTTRRLIVVACIDNLLKGAAGQAVQNFNLAYGFSECDGLL
ncbi:MAG: N-acetyl-gamma-glutamyl-phosphate reductase [Luteitalea sp.]|nr:N-acetyl-gamma-glutamyl-phosphate reductase [Luteitalea sp.]